MNKPAIFREVDDDIFQAQVEAGLLTNRDLETLNAQNRASMYPRIGLIVGAVLPVVYARTRRLPWPFLKTALWSISGGAGLGASGMYFQIRSVVGAVNELEDRNRFKEAVKEMGIEMKRRRQGVSSSKHDTGVVRDEEREAVAGGWKEGGADANSEKQYNEDGSVPIPNETSNRPPSRWSEIRASRSKEQQTTWDVIRQANDKKAGQATKSAQPSPHKAPSDEKDDAQAQFDALLDAERKIGTEVSAESLDEDGSSFGQQGRNASRRWW